ncbi:MAG: PAS domain S-box protein [Bacteroidales bacterium]|jgi:PAS domain S-box-containing protein
MIKTIFQKLRLVFSGNPIVCVSLLIVFILSFLDLIGWMFNITLFKSISSHWIPMKVITALCFAFSNTALIFIKTDSTTRIKAIITKTLGLTVSIVGLLTIIIYTIFLKTGIEATFVYAPFLKLFLAPQTKMAFFSAINFFIIGIALILIATKSIRNANIAHVLMLPAAIFSYMVPVSYIIGAYSLHEIHNVPVALNTGIAFIALSSAVYFIRTDTWLMKVFTSNNAGGLMARKLLPWLIILPVVIGWLRILGEHKAIYGSEVGVTIVALTYTVCFLFLVWLSAKSVNKTDEEKQKSEEQLNEREVRFRSIFENSNDAIVLLDAATGKYIDCNQVTCKMSGYTKEEICNMKTGGLLSPPHKDEVISNMDIINKIGTLRGETELITKDGLLIPIEFSASSLTIGNMQCLVSFIRDISERKKTEEELIHSRQEWVETFNIIPDLIAIIDNDFRIVKANKAMLNKLGVSFKDAQGLRCFECIHGDDKPYHDCPHAMMLKDGKQHLSEVFEKNLGGYFLVSVTPVLNSTGKIIGSVHVAHDITERKNTEEALKINNERLEILSETASRLLESDNPQKLVNELCNKVMKFLDCQVFFNFLVDENEGKLNLNAYSGIPEKTAKNIKWLDYGVAVCGCVASEGIRIIAENIPDSPDPRTDLVKSLGVKAYACHPLLSEGKVIGTLSFGTKSRVKFSDDGIAMMKAVANQVAIAMTKIRNQEELKQSEQRYRLLVDSLPDTSIHLFDHNKKFLIAGGSEITKSGFDKNLIEGHTLHEAYPPEVINLLEPYYDKALHGESSSFEHNYDNFWYHQQIVPIYDSEGKIYAGMVISQNITERKKAEKELYDTKNYLENLINYANAPIIVWNPQSEIQLFNGAFEHLTGYSSAEVVGKKLDFLFPETSLKETNEKIKLALSQNWETIEIPILTKNKETRIVFWNSANIYDTDNKTLISTIAQGNDITERKKAEEESRKLKEKLDLALKNANIGVWVWDIKTNVIEWDERMEQIFGIEKGTFGKNYDVFEKFIVDEDIPHTRKAISKAIDENVPFETIYRIKLNNGDIKYINAKALLTKNNVGEAISMTGVCFDITEMKKGTEQALFKLNEDLLRSNKELEQFAYVASHDLQEPLRTVSSFTQLLSHRYKDRLDAEAQEFIQFAVDGAMRMQVLINDLLVYSRIQVKGKPFTNVDMHEVLGQVINNLTMRIQEKNALVTCYELPTVIADEGQMVQLLQNLIGNAIKFCNAIPIIHISSKEEKDYFIFSIKDNGIGIESQYFDRIFQIFQRLHTKEEYSGTGIGLAVCKRIVERHKGTIWVESEFGKGTTFYFKIPKKTSASNTY